MINLRRRFYLPYKKDFSDADYLTHELASLQAAINSIAVGFIITDVNGQIITINRAAKKIIYLGQHSPQVKIEAVEPDLVKVECTLPEICQKLAQTIDLKSEIDKCLQNKQSLYFEELAYRDMILHLTISPAVVLKDKKNLDLDVVGTVILIEDVTEEKLLERAKNEFFSIATHEMKTPLAVIKGNAEIIMKYFPYLLENEQMKQMILDMHESSIRLLGMTNDFLDASRLEQGKMHFNNSIVNLKQLIDQVVSEFIYLARTKSLEITVNGPPDLNVSVDPEMFKQVMSNLINNAIKFTEKGGVTITFAERASSCAISIKDTGIGIAPEYQKLIFRKFQLANDNLYTRETSRSTGLGLYIAKLMIDGMGGKIALTDSEVGVGSTFSIFLPLAQ